MRTEQRDQPSEVIKPPRAPFGVMRDSLRGSVGDLVTSVEEVKWEAGDDSGDGA